MDKKHEQTSTTDTTTERAERRGRRLTPFKAAVAAGSSAVLALTLSACGEKASAQPVDTSSAPAATAVETAPASTPTPTPTETTPASTPTETAETAPTVESLELKADLPPADLAKATLDFFNDWITAGATADTIDKTDADSTQYMMHGGTEEDYAAQLAKQNADNLYAPALFGPNWESDGNSFQQAFYQEEIQTNAQSILAALSRKNNGLGQASFVVGVQSAQEATDVPAGERQILFDATITDQGGSADGRVSDWKLQRFTYKVQDGVAYLVSDGRSQ